MVSFLSSNVFFQNLKRQQTTFHPLDKANWLKYPGLIKIYFGINGCQVVFGQKFVLKPIQTKCSNSLSQVLE